MMLRRSRDTRMISIAIPRGFPTLARAIIGRFPPLAILFSIPSPVAARRSWKLWRWGVQAFGTDISSLAAFVSEVKTTIYSEKELGAITRWIVRAQDRVHMHGHAASFAEYEDAGYYRNLSSAETWRLESNRADHRVGIAA